MLANVDSYAVVVLMTALSDLGDAMSDWFPARQVRYNHASCLVFVGGGARDHTVRPWKGTAGERDIVVAVNPNAAWSPQPKDARGRSPATWRSGRV